MTFGVNLIPKNSGNTQQTLGNSENKWDIYADNLTATTINNKTPVSGVKGNSESSYRTGNVNLTPANIGAKATQTAVSKPTASGTAIAFIDDISQNEQGVISPTKKTIPIANNLTETTTGKVLDATQGKILNDRINNLTPASIGAKATQTAVSKPTASGTSLTFIDDISQNEQGVITPTKKTVATVTTSAAGLMSAADKTKLDGITAGAAVTSVNDQTGAVSITPANIGAVSLTGDSTIVGNLYAGTTSDTDFRRIGVKSAAGTIYFYSSGSSGGNRGIWIDNGSSAKNAMSVDSDNKVTLDGNVTGTATNVTDTVIIDHGGTGATNAADARTKLGITPANIGAMVSSPSHISFTTLSNTTNGGYIDFHYQGASSYTSRLIESASGVLKITSNLSLGHPLSIDNGGTGATTTANACANLAPGIPTSNYTVITSYGTNLSKNSTTNDTDNLRCIKYGNGLKRITGLFKVTGGTVSPGSICTVTDAFARSSTNNGAIQGWFPIIGKNGSIHIGRMNGTDVRLWANAMPEDTYAIDYLYF